MGDKLKQIKDLSLEERFQIVQEFVNKPPQSSKELYQFTEALTGQATVFKKVCEDHQTPWDFLWGSYKIDIPKFTKESKRSIVAMGPRGGEKTLTQAKLMAAELLLKPNLKTVSLAATLEQSKTGFEYLGQFLKAEPAANLNLIEKFLTEEVSLYNGSRLKLACATLAGTNSKHCPKVYLDEVELIEEKCLNEAKMIMQSDGITDYIPRTTYISTRKEIDGLMERTLQEGKKRNWQITTWCIKEMSEPCPEERRGRAKKAYEIKDIENPGETVLVEAWEGCGTAGRDGGPCELLQVCQGDLAFATGTHPIDDSIYQFIDEDRLYYIAQRLCRTPKRGNMFFEDFSEKLQASTPFDYNPEWPVDFAMDFSNGGDSPTTCWLVQEDQHGNEWILACLYYYKKPTEIVGSGIKQFCNDLGITRVRMQLGDSAQKQEIMNLNAYDPSFFHIIPCSKIRRDEGWPLIRRVVMDNSGRRRAHLNPKYCKELIKEILKAVRARSNPDDISNLCPTHGLDAWRYYEVRMHGFRGEPRMRLLEQPGSDFKPTVNMPSDPAPTQRDRDSSGSLDRQIRDFMDSDE